MRGLVLLIAATSIFFAASPASAQRYDPAYPVCKDVVDGDGERMECFYNTMEQCKQSGPGGTCLNNPYYRPAPAAAAPAAEPAPTPSPAAAKKQKR
jgi:Protein of unknown function (DUF3551)